MDGAQTILGMKSAGRLRRRTSNSQLPGPVSTVDAVISARSKHFVAARLDSDRRWQKALPVAHAPSLLEATRIMVLDSDVSRGDFCRPATMMAPIPRHPHSPCVLMMGVLASSPPPPTYLHGATAMASACLGG